MKHVDVDISRAHWLICKAHKTCSCINRSVQIQAFHRTRAGAETEGAVVPFSFSSNVTPRAPPLNLCGGATKVERVKANKSSQSERALTLLSEVVILLHDNCYSLLPAFPVRVMLWQQDGCLPANNMNTVCQLLKKQSWKHHSCTLKGDEPHLENEWKLGNHLSTSTLATRKNTLTTMLRTAVS